jgi:hypothetical protein
MPIFLSYATVLQLILALPSCLQSQYHFAFYNRSIFTMVDAWTKAQTIATFISLGAILIAAFALVVDRIRLVHKRDDHLKATDPRKMRYFYTNRLEWWETLFGEQSPVLNIPRVAGLIEAGDRGFWTSAALDRILEGHAEITWVPLFASIFEEVSHSNSHLGRDCGEMNTKS